MPDRPTTYFLVITIAMIVVAIVVGGLLSRTVNPTQVLAAAAVGWALAGAAPGAGGVAWAIALEPPRYPLAMMCALIGLAMAGIAGGCAAAAIFGAGMRAFGV